MEPGQDQWQVVSQTPTPPNSSTTPAQPSQPSSGGANPWQVVSQTPITDQSQPSIGSKVVDAAWHLPGVEEAKGFVKSGLQSASGLLNLIHNNYGNFGDPSDVTDYQKEHPGATDQQAMDAVQAGYRGQTSKNAQQDLKDSADWLKSHSQQHGFFQNLGGVGESIAELMGPEALGILGKTSEAAQGAKVASYADRLKSGQKIAQVLNDHPVLAKVVAAGMRALRGSAGEAAGRVARGAAEAGAQTYVKTGGDTGEALESAKLAGMIGAPLEGASAAVRAGIEHISPTVENLGGTNITRLKSQEAHATPLQRAAATAEKSPEVQAAQQEAGQEIIGNAAKRTAAGHLEELNAGRENPQPYKFRVSDTETEDPAALRDAMRAKREEILSPEFDALSDAEQKTQLNEYHQMQNQIGEYHATQPKAASIYANRSTFEPVNIQDTVKRVGSYGDAADELEAAAKPVYDRLDDLTAGRFQELRDENRQAWRDVNNGGGEKAQQRLQASNKQMDAMLSGRDPLIGDSVNPQDLSYANEAWKKAQMLRDVHAKIESSFDNTIGMSQRANSYRGFDGNRLRSSINKLSMKYGDRQLSRILGPEQYTNLTKLADITRTTSDRAKFGSAVNEVAKSLISLIPHGGFSGAGYAVGHALGGSQGGTMGAAAGEAAYLAGKRVMRAVATNPAIGRNLSFAIESGARPEIYAPMIASQIAKEDNDQ